MGNRVSNSNDTRTVIVGEINKEDKKRDNRIKTSKYTLLTFPVQNIFEQLRRVANVYFFIVTVIAVLIDSPVSPITSLVPLAFVLVVTMAKQGYEDWLRHVADYSVNNERVSVIRSSTLVNVKCHEIRPGEIVKIPRDCDVPCDSVLLWTSDTRGKCFVTTANLDGETSLKPLKVPAPLARTTFEEKCKEKITLECLEPEADIYAFYGKIKIGEDINSPLGAENLLLRGSRVKNTEWAICCAVYTGKETKLALNSRITRNKFTSSESFINKYLLFFIVLLIAEMLISFFLKRYLENLHVGYEKYLGQATSSNSIVSIAQDAFSFLLLYYYCIPISLYVTVELHKFIGSLYFDWDERLYCSETNQPALANNSDLNEELGQIEILFSDKTGTLTKNDMYFQMCSVNGQLYIEKDNRLYEMNHSWERRETVQAVATLNLDLDFFFKVLALCHTVQVEETENWSSLNGKNNLDQNCNTVSDKIKYQAMSSDEIAFVRAAANRGIVFCGDDASHIFIRKNGQIEPYEKLQVIEFTSARKRMSIIVKDSIGRIWLLCKGAESSVLPLCKDDHLLAVTNSHVQYFAEHGLRTLAIAFKQLTVEQYENLNEEICRLNMDIHGRASGAGQMRFVEEGLTLLGATGVEDRLQDNVENTLEALRMAGIKIWVLTGDKVETAINVAQSCGHIPEKTEKLFLTDVVTVESLNVQLEENLFISEHSTAPLTLIMDGQSFALITGKLEQEKFVKMSLKCEAVICCRLSPMQKAQIVRLIKKSPERPITAAVGDGANDISMIQEAHVGFGIFGREGRQAARCADFAFTKFMMLKRILLVHGHWYYQRHGTLVQYSFYKNLTFVNLMIFFQIHSEFSTQSILDSMFLMLFNIVFASAPIFVLSLTEQCHSQNLLMGNPLLYKKQVKNKVLSWKNFFGWLFLAVYHSVIIFYSFYLLFYFNPVISADGNTSDMWCFGAAIFHCLVIVINLKLWLTTRYNTAIYIASVILSIASFVIFNTIYSYFDFKYDGDTLRTYIRLLSSLTFWQVTLIVTIGCMIPDYVTYVYKSIVRKKIIKKIDKIEIVETTKF